MTNSLSNTQIMHWIEAVCHVWHQHGKLSQREYDSIKHQLQGKPNGISPIMWLLQQESEFLDILSLWYGPSGIGSNLIRFGTCSYMPIFFDLFQSWESATIQLAKQHFNRVVHVGDKSGFDSTQLFSSIMEDFAQVIHRTRVQWKQLYQKIHTLHSTTLAQPSEDELSIDKEVCTQLGLHSTTANVLPLSLENQTRQQIVFDLQNIVNWIENFYLEVTGSDTNIYWSEVMMAGEDVISYAHRLASHRIPTHSHLAQWDLCRLNIEETLHKLSNSLTKYIGCFQTALTHHIPKILEKSPLPGSIQRRIAYSHIEKGIAPKTAIDAVSKLADYIEANRINPEKLINTELPLIHHELQVDTLDVIQELKQDYKTGKEEKRRILQSFKKMTEVVALIVFTLHLTSCGVKTLPINENLEPRPEMPFKVYITPKKDISKDFSVKP